MTDGFVCSRTLAFRVNSTFKGTSRHVPRILLDKFLISKSVNDASNNSEIARTNILLSNLGLLVPISLLFQLEDLHNSFTGPK